ncbi:putative ubiquitin-protein ligase [Cavenderia fasciculata]|uniref:HECT-type E3 ubiquitin transferase n=1 Tax=Cavenderia fasciculata TaxID=261658 RepID=F4QEL4_CACFS|nr:putative ubiquitin-protein ligase [Cavenderia fasciculata]EGG14125.1 putative ubiquitin-protein ligase [Cavenderia fasciculata]|eukprot:XP_004350833.1 putative ubiquitin-protein ligase [Cavenderia fasciculata]
MTRDNNKYYFVDDKVWLGIPEENLFNDSFTIEKYYMLQSKPLSNFRDADHFKSIELLEDSFFPSYKDRYLGDEEIFQSDGSSDSKSDSTTTTNQPNSSQQQQQQQVSTPREQNTKPSVPTSASTMSLGNTQPPPTPLPHLIVPNNNTTNQSNNRNNNNNNNSGNRQRSGSNATINVNNNNRVSNQNNNNNNTRNRNSTTQPNNNNNNPLPSTSSNTSSSSSVPPVTSTSTTTNSTQQNNNSSSSSSTTASTSTTSQELKNNLINNNSLYTRYNEELKNRQSIPVYLIDEDPFHTHEITTQLLLEDLYTQSNVNSAYYSTLLQKRLAILKRIHLALKREIARKKLYDSVYHSKAKTRTKKVHTPPVSIRIACRLFITTLQEQVFEQRISLPTLKSFNSMIRDLPPLSMAGEPIDCIDSLTKWLLSAIATNVVTVKREAMESLISLGLSQGSLSAILFSLSLIIMPEKINQPITPSHNINNINSNSNNSIRKSSEKQTDNNNPSSNSSSSSLEKIDVSISTLRLVPFIRQLEQWKVDLPLSPLSRDLLFSTWPILWNNMAEETDDSLAFLSLPNSNIATIASDGEYIYIHDTCGLAKIGTGYNGTHQGRVYARDPNWFPKEKGWMAVIGTHIYYRSPSTEPYSLYVIDAMNLQVLGGVKQDGTGTFPSTNNLTLPFGPETTQSTVDESIFLTPHYQITTRSPMFTDGRYLYILSLQRFHSYNNKQFIVDIYDPQSQFNHIKRIELRYPDTDINEGLVLNPMILEFGSFYTNGHYLMVVIPPSLGSEIFYESKVFVCRAFSLSDGTLVGNYGLENQPIGLASCYDYLNNVVWNYSSSESEIGKYGNEGFGPKHNFPSIVKLQNSNKSSTTTTTNQTNQPQQQSQSNQVGGNNSSINTSVVEIDDNYGMEPKQVVSTILGILSRLAVDYMPSASEESSTIHHLYKLNESYSVEVNFSTFSQLYSILKHYQSQLRIGYSVTSPKTIDILRCIIYCLRLLKVNLFRLTSNIRSLESSTQPVQDASRDSLLKCIDQTFLHQLRDLLLGFIIDGIEGSTNEIAEFHTIIEESCEVLTIGLDLFYPTSLNKANFVFNLLEQVMNQRQNQSTQTQSTVKTNNMKSNQQNRGYSMLLNSVLSLLANHPNASFFSLPPLCSELPSPFSLFNLETPDNGAGEHRPFDPMNLFVPIITHLIVEAQATIPKQSIPQLSRQDSSQQHLGFSLYSSAPPPPLSNSSPAMRLLLAVQKDLILRVENSIVGTDAPSQALVAYSRLLMDKCKELLLAVLDSDPQPHRSNHQSILLTDFKSSVVGALLPSLIHSLFLFSYHIWLAKELLPSLVQLIGVVDRVNRRLPKLLNRPELGRQPLQKRSSFVEGPIRISESPHPYHPFMNSRQLVSIPNAVFLSLVFDERSCTSSNEDMLQIYESADSKEPLDQFYLSQWPKRRVLVPGDTVVFQFVSGGINPQTPYAHWGYRCNIIGHMPNSDKTSLPWSAHLEKTMCCLAGRFSSCLISGDPVTELERQNKSILESALFSGGCEEEYVSHVLFSTPQQDNSNSNQSHPHPHPQPQPQPYPSSEFSTNPSTRAIQRFCVSLARRNGEVYSQTLSDFMWQHVTGERRASSLVVTKGTIRMAQQAVIASLLKHLNLGELAIQFTFELIQHRQFIENDTDPKDCIIKPPQVLIDVWRTSYQIRNAIIQKHQENQVLNNTVVINSAEEESVKRRSVDFKTHATLRETIYKDITDQVTEKSMFLLELDYAIDQNENNNINNNNNSSSSSSLNAKQTELLNLITRFVVSNVSLEDMKRILVSRRSRAFTRSIGLQAMRDILRCASDHSMKQEVLCFIGPALRNSGLVRRRAPPFHYLDHLYGCGSRLLLDIKKNFRALMEDIAMLLQDTNSDHTLKYYALDAFTLNFTSEDADLLTSIDIFNKINNLMTTDSIWGGLWSSSSVGLSNPTGSNPAGILLHSQSSSSIGSAGSGGGSNLFSSSAMIEEEKMEREKLKQTAKALFKFLGLICVDNQIASSNNNNKSLDTLRDSFFHFMETQLESSLLFLSEQNKTYWYGCDLPLGGMNSPSSPESTSPPNNQQQKNRRLLRGGERSLFNYDFSEGLSLLYILSAFNSVKQRLTSPSFINIFYSILQVGDESQRKLTLRIFRRILPFTSPSKLILKNQNNQNNQNNNNSNKNTINNNNNLNNNIGISRMNDSKSLLTLLFDIIGAISYWGCSSDLLETSKYLDPRFFITSSNYNLFFSSNYSTKLDSTHSFFSIFDKSIVLPTCWDGKTTTNIGSTRFSDDSRTVTYQPNPTNLSTNPSDNFVFIKSDEFIPDSLPIFYFEIKIESDNAHCVVGLFPVEEISQLKTLKEWKHGYGYNGKDGHKLCHRLGAIRSRAYANSFTRNDIVGCGWNRKDGKIFFTKNGKYLGAAFKNVIYGDLVPVVMIESGVSVSCNFGHNASFNYDVASLTSSHLESAISERNLPSMALCYVSEVVSLVRLLLRTESWRIAIQRHIEEGLRLLPSTIVQVPPTDQQKDSHGGKVGPTIQSLLSVFSVITLLAGHLDGLWTGSRVSIELAAGIYEKGTIVDYSQLSNQATVLLDSNIDRLYRTTHPLGVIKPISEVTIDFSQFLPPHSSIINLLSIFLRPTINEKEHTNNNDSNNNNNNNNNNSNASQLSLLFRTNQRNIYLFIKSRAMKVMGSLLKYSECTRYTLEEMLVPVLVEFALGRPIQFLDEPKIDTMERFSFLLKERIYSNSFKSFLYGNNQNIQNNQKSNNNNNNSNNNQIESSEEYGTITEVEFDDDNDMIDIEEFDEIAMLDGDEDDSLDSIKDEKKEKKSSTTVTSLNPNLEDEDTTVGEDEENVVEDEIVEGIQGKRIPWLELQVGMSVLVAKREKLGLCRSNWTVEMDRIIGQVGIIKSIDKKHKQVLVTFIDEEIFSLVDWWLCCEIFIYPPSTDKSSKHPLLSIDKYSQSQLVHLDASCELALSILFSRQALISLLVSIPSSQKISYASFGGAKNLIYILKLTLHTSLLGNSTTNGKSRLNNNLSMIYSSGMKNINNNSTMDHLQLLQQKLTLLLIQENNNNGNNSNNNTSTSSELEQLSNELLNSLSSSTSSISSLNSSLDGKDNKDLIINNNNNNSSSSSSSSSSSNNNSKWKSYKPPTKQQLSISTSTLLNNEPLKNGFLMKQQKILKLWKRVWVVLSGDTLFYYKSNPINQNSSNNTIASSTMTLIGSIDLRDIVSVTQVNIMKQPTKIIFTVKKEFCFQVTVASNKTHLFQAKSQEELNEWLQIINSACISSAAFRSKSNTLSSNSLVEVLVKESAAQLRDTAHEPIQQLVEESAHPYPIGTKSKKIIRIDGALALLVVFDPRTATEPGSGRLGFYYDPCCTDYIGSYSGKSFAPTLVQSCQFWMVQHNEGSNNSEWGFKFTVTPIRLRTSDISLLPRPSFEFACFLLDWILQLDGSFFTTKYPNLFSLDLVDLLMTHIDGNQPFDRKLKVITFLTRILAKQRDSNQTININSKIENLREEMFKLVKLEQQSNLISQYLQRLIELVIQYELNLDHNNQILQQQQTTLLQSNQTNNPYINNNLVQQPTNDQDESKSWFYRTLASYRVIRRLVQGKGFSREFIKESFRDTRNKMAVDSPHPYPPNVRVTANVLIPRASSLKIEFDQKSKTQNYVDYLMFSKSTPGGDDLGFFTGDFPNQPIIIQGDRFIWSFFSDSSEGEWGFRFYVSPIFNEEIQKENEIQYDQEIEYLLSHPFTWNHYMDLELVKFINTLCEKLKKTPSQLIFEQCCITEYLILYPMLYELKDVYILGLRFNILKHFNECCKTFIQYIDQRGVCEDWSIAYQLSSLRGLLFYDEKMELFMDSLKPSQSLCKRPFLSLNRHQNIQDQNNNNNLSSSSSSSVPLLDSLFIQTFKQIYYLEPSKLRFNDRAWEVKLEREGARDAGGPYRETMTQIVSELSSLEMNLFLPCQNAQGDVAFNRDKLVPNSSQTSSHSLALYEFIGRLIGIAIRTRNCIELSFPSLFWKSLVSAKIDRQDLEAIDKYTVNILEMINHNGSSRNSIDQEAFGDLFQSFTAKSIDNTVVELLHEGRNIPVTWHNRFEYARLLELYKMNEFKLQMDAIIRGVSLIVPLHLLNIFTWQELELSVCGMPGLDIKLLKRHTRYCGLSANEPRVQWFWKTLESFSSEEQTLFLRFVWGRSRLPPSNEFNIQFQLQVFLRDSGQFYDDEYNEGERMAMSMMHENQDEYLPEAQTCFFTLSLPNYSSADVMKEKLLYAITTCRDIDADFIVIPNV